jgi:hypothetical protein
MFSIEPPFRQYHKNKWLPSILMLFFSYLTDAIAFEGDSIRLNTKQINLPRYPSLKTFQNKFQFPIPKAFLEFWVVPTNQ